MKQEQSNAELYLDHAAKLRQFARQTRYLGVRARLLWVAAGFERLADQAERWEEAGLPRAVTERAQFQKRTIPPARGSEAGN
jgi:hypothetical protein